MSKQQFIMRETVKTLKKEGIPARSSAESELLGKSRVIAFWFLTESKESVDRKLLRSDHYFSVHAYFDSQTYAFIPEHFRIDLTSDGCEHASFPRKDLPSDVEPQVAKFLQIAQAEVAKHSRPMLANMIEVDGVKRRWGCEKRALYAACLDSGVEGYSQESAMHAVEDALNRERGQKEQAGVKADLLANVHAYFSPASPSYLDHSVRQDIEEQLRALEHVTEKEASPRKVAIVWSPGDVETLRPDWTPEECQEALDTIGKHLQERSVEVGWEIMGTLLDEMEANQLEDECPSPV